MIDAQGEKKSHSFIRGLMKSAVDGLTARVERKVYDAEGNLIHQDTFVSEYAPRRAAYHYGPGYEPPEEAAEPED